MFGSQSSQKGTIMSRRSLRIRPALGGVALLAAALAIAGGGAGAALAAPSSHQAVSGPKVPVGEVGPGWSIAEYSAASVPNDQGHSTPGQTTLFAVSPQGRKYPFYTWPAAALGPSTYAVIGWASDPQRVLVQNFDNKLEQISLATGKVINSFKLPAGVA